jgi:hypothetical protein
MTVSKGKKNEEKEQNVWTGKQSWGWESTFEKHKVLKRKQ